MKLVHIGTDTTTRQEHYVNMEEYRILQILPDIQSTPNNPHTSIRMERSTIGRPVTYLEIAVIGASEKIFRLIQDQLADLFPRDYRPTTKSAMRERENKSASARKPG